MLASIRRILLLSTKMSTGILCFLLAMTWSVFFLVTFSEVTSSQCSVVLKYTIFCLCKTEFMFCSVGMHLGLEKLC
jgi:hypothetical protein